MAKKPAKALPVVPAASPASIVSTGSTVSNIDVRISYRIITLFSEGLYRSPHKAIEELVSNAFDAGARNTHVLISPDLRESNATIVVIDDGIGMDEAGLKQHWLIGESNKRDSAYKLPLGRKQIGKFGIGKLATYVLCNVLTHITKTNGKYFATTMDYRKIPTSKNGIETEVVQLPLRELTALEASDILLPWINGNKDGYEAMKLFGKGASESWTVAIMSDLKDMATEIRLGTLRWVLGTAMPLRDDFCLYLDGDLIEPAKVNSKRLDRWVLGSDIKALPKPAPDDLEVIEDSKLPKNSVHHFGLSNPKLGRVTGYFEIYEDILTSGKSADLARSHGFFVYVRGRLINMNDDEYFGIDSNALRHGTFSRFRMVLHVDGLDDELRSSRESLREGPLMEITRNILRAAFNFARIKHEEFEKKQQPGVQSAERIAASPVSLTQRPLVDAINRAFDGNYTPRYITYPGNLTEDEKKDFLSQLRGLMEEPGGIVQSIQIVDSLASSDGLAQFDAQSRTLKINMWHPYVAHFLGENNQHPSVALELLGMAEVLLEAHLLELGLTTPQVHDALSLRDELLRSLSRSTGKRNALHIGRALLDASTNKDNLEIELVACFDSMGFSDAIRIGKSGNPDGSAVAKLAPNEDETPRTFKVTLEAKSMEKIGKKVSAGTVKVSTIARHRDNHKATFSIVVGPDFSAEVDSAIDQEIAADRKNNAGRGITLISIEDMARLVRLVPAKRVGLERLRQLFETCSLPSESKNWIDALEKEQPEIPPYKQLLEVIENEQSEMKGGIVEYSSIATRMRIEKKITMEKRRVIELCKALSSMVPEYVRVREVTVELMTRPDKILQALRETTDQYPEGEQKHIL